MSQSALVAKIGSGKMAGGKVSGVKLTSKAIGLGKTIGAVPTFNTPANSSAFQKVADQYTGVSGAATDPRDPTYFSTLAQNTFTRDQSLTNLDTTDTRAGTDAQTALQRIAHTYAQARENAAVSANKQGLFNSGQLGKAYGNIEDSLGENGTEATDVKTNLARRLADSSQTRLGLAGEYGDASKPNDYGIAGASAYSDAVARQVNAPPQAVAPPTQTPHPGVYTPPPGAMIAGPKPPSIHAPARQPRQPALKLTKGK